MGRRRESGPSRLASLLHHRWAVPVITELHRSAGAKVITLEKRLGVSRDSLRRTLDDLIARGLVTRNPGYGHPLRPELILTAAGRRAGPACERAMQILAREGLVDQGLRKWSLAVVLALGAGHARFSELKPAMPRATARALAMTLRQLEETGLLERRVLAVRPPRSEYQLTPRGRRWVPALEALAAACPP